ncbi:MAG: glycoside hydrolase family 3 C-terminal domain-containing protein [Anaerolineae bacterium]|nr:glycoside hydrolase family 3 C-terminal domain-containing protein [Anaerolineae bacterium]MCX8067702.1 glycoside hydrolase family 3 C-terminal domain-containing protein [Anaerolineae bacterium]MDW7992771.1 glycoside hydrolase family 3 C-terminal domain-containing protein [Anaerolineae bacterium]MDW8069156.1 glycoside hydrolase family 3 C-terminal domain-containing protein [Anaerolineae bacterium]
MPGNSEIERRVDELLSRMTLEEKISQMVFDAPAIERLGIPPYNWWNECLHGVARAGLATVFPQAIGLAATWNPDLLFQVAEAISDEARAKHHEALRKGIREIYTGLTFWSPTINIFRDPRWGRGQETYGEDPYLTARMGVAFVQGLQGNDPHYLKVVATPKHFAVHSGPEPFRHHFDARVQERDLRETYLFAFEACVKEGKAASVMGAYNRVNGEPCCAHPLLLEQILRQEWGFEGYVVSDCGAIHDIYAQHQVVATPEEAAARAVQAGCDLECGGIYYALKDAVQKGLISEEAIDRAVRRLFRARFRLGMFDPPEKVPYAQIPHTVVSSGRHRELALQAARESIVLLKNEGNLLPLPRDLRAIAVVGPNADDVRVLLGNYNGTPARVVTPLEGIRKKVAPTTCLYFAPGCEIARGVPPMEVIPSNCLYPTTGDGYGRGLWAEYYANENFAGEPAICRVDPCVNFVWAGTTPLTGAWGDDFAVRWTGYLVPPVSGLYHIGVNGFSEYRLYLDDKLLVSYKGIHHPLLHTVEVYLEGGRFYSVRLEYVSRGLDPQVQLLWSPPGFADPERALEAARKADVVIAVMGLSPMLEGEEMPVEVEGFFRGDRTDIGLPAPQEEFLRQLHALGKPVVLVLLNGGALAVTWAAEHIPAILEAWYPGEAGGEAIADVLFGDYNPGGRLPVTFYRSVTDLPPFEDYQMEGRTYRYFRGEPLFPFGYGLSYTTFVLENLQITPERVGIGGEITVQVDVVNTGSWAGDEVVQLYVRHRHAPPPHPIQELKGFQRLHLRPGERKTVVFTLHTYQLGLYDESGHYMVWPGTVEIMVGHSSRDLPLAGTVELEGTPTDAGSAKVFFSRVQVLR